MTNRAPFKHKEGLREEKFRGAKLTGELMNIYQDGFLNFAPGRQN